MLLPENRGFIHRIASEIPPQRVFQTRRALIASLAAAATLGTRHAFAQAKPLPATRSTVPGALTMEKPTPLADVSGYNNYYEFGIDKSDPARHAQALRTR